MYTKSRLVNKFLANYSPCCDRFEYELHFPWVSLSSIPRTMSSYIFSPSSAYGRCNIPDEEIVAIWLTKILVGVWRLLIIAWFVLVVDNNMLSRTRWLSSDNTKLEKLDGAGTWICWTAMILVSLVSYIEFIDCECCRDVLMVCIKITNCWICTIWKIIDEVCRWSNQLDQVHEYTV